MGTRAKDPGEQVFRSLWAKHQGDLIAVAKELKLCRGTAIKYARKYITSKPLSRWTKLNQVAKELAAYCSGSADPANANVLDPRHVALRNRLIVEALPYVTGIVKAMVNGEDHQEDAIQDASLKLLECCDQFNPKLGSFSTWAAIRIRGAILDKYREADYVPRLLRAEEKSFESSRSELEALLNRAPNEDEVFRFDGNKNPRIKGLESLDAESGWDPNYLTNNFMGRGVSHHDTVQDKSIPESVYLNRFHRLVDGLDLESQTLLFLYYFKGVTMKELGKIFKLCESRISQIHTDLIGRLKLVA